MRPVERGPWPVDEGGAKVRFREYTHARPHLIARIGDYCSYCELPLGAGLAAEHVRAKSSNSDLERRWDNLLLACTNCNSTKLDKVSTQADVDARLWPDKHRTFDAFRYQAGGEVVVAEHDDSELVARAQATLDMVGLDRRPQYGITREQGLSGSDRRWAKRQEAWRAASEAREDLLALDTPGMRRRILSDARHTGFWSVWMTVFADDEVMRRELCDALPGTAHARVF